jgi:catechol 2,3-dioxygenase-like lactoylglutathione lyase family enzyme
MSEPAGPLAVDYSRCYHQGVRVPDLEAAMAELGSAMALDWCEPQQRDQALWLPDVGTTSVPLRFTYSAAGPQHVELLQGAPGSVWDGREQPGLHHVGLWSEDVAGETEQLVAAGWVLRLAQRDPADGYGVFTYVQPPSGLLVELVSTAVKPMFERWFAGGQLA